MVPTSNFLKAVLKTLRDYAHCEVSKYCSGFGAYDRNALSAFCVSIVRTSTVMAGFHET